MVYKKNEELRLEDIPDNVDTKENQDKVHELRFSFDLRSVKSKIPMLKAHKDFFRFLKGEKLSLTELRIALWGVLDLNRWTVNNEEDEKKHREQVMRLLDAIKDKIKKKDFA